MRLIVVAIRSGSGILRGEPEVYGQLNHRSVYIAFNNEAVSILVTVVSSPYRAACPVACTGITAGRLRRKQHCYARIATGSMGLAGGSRGSCAPDVTFGLVGHNIQTDFFLEEVTVGILTLARSYVARELDIVPAILIGGGRCTADRI
jgi:hypothetical protein